MHLHPTDEQAALQEAVRIYCDRRYAFASLAGMEEQPIDPDRWQELADLGVFNLRVPVERGGLGLGATDTVLVFEELGKRLVPGPLLWTQLAADYFAGTADGKAIVGGLDLHESPAGPFVIEHLDGLDMLLLLRDDGLYRIRAAELTGRRLDNPLDPLTPVHEVATLPTGERIGDAEAARQTQRTGTLLAAALLMGIAHATLEIAVEYAQTREQFGRPVGSFQALKHMMADMYVRAELARSAVYGAATIADQPDVGSAERAVSAAKHTAGQSALRNSRACLQIHGGMGFTWEMPPHYYLKRTWVLENSFGTTAQHARNTAVLTAACRTE
jgi:alkylation response protein AidB-like acyl-CoA dehydrogenase